MSRTSPAEFIRQVRNEMKKVTWPTGRETMISMIAVFVMVFLSSTFLYLADQTIAWALHKIMNIGL